MFIFTGSLIIAIFCNGCPSIATQQTIGKLTEIQQITVKHEFQWWGRWNWSKRWFNGSRGENPSKTRENKSTNWCSEKVHFIIHCYSLTCNAWSVIFRKSCFKSSLPKFIITACRYQFTANFNEYTNWNKWGYWIKIHLRAVQRNQNNSPPDNSSCLSTLRKLSIQGKIPFFKNQFYKKKQI